MEVSVHGQDKNAEIQRRGVGTGRPELPSRASGDHTGPALGGRDAVKSPSNTAVQRQSREAFRLLPASWGRGGNPTLQGGVKTVSVPPNDEIQQPERTKQKAEPLPGRELT